MAFLSHNVFRRRLETIRQHLLQTNSRALIVLNPDNFFYVSGFFLDVAPWERPVAAIIPLDAEPVLALCELSTNHVKMAKARGSLWITDTRLYTEHPRVTNRTYTVLQFPQMVAGLLQEKGIHRGEVLLDSSPGRLGQIKDHLPGIQFGDGLSLLRKMRATKCDEELELIRQGSSLSDWGQEQFRTIVKPGRLMSEVDAETLRLTVAEGARRFPDAKLEVRVSSLTGPASASPHGTGGDAGLQIEKGHGIVNITIVRLNGLVTENERTYFVGKPSRKQAEAFRVVTEAQELAIQHMIAGETLANIDAAAQEVIQEAGFADYIVHRTGHGIGIAGHEWPEDMAWNPRVLVPDEVLSAEPGIYIYGLGGFRHDDTVIVHEDEPEVTTKATKNLEDQIIPV